MAASEGRGSCVAAEFLGLLIVHRYEPEGGFLGPFLVPTVFTWVSRKVYVWMGSLSGKVIQEGGLRMDGNRNRTERKRYEELVPFWPKYLLRSFRTICPRKVSVSPPRVALWVLASFLMSVGEEWVSPGIWGQEVRNAHGA